MAKSLTYIATVPTESCISVPQFHGKDLDVVAV